MHVIDNILLGNKANTKHNAYTFAFSAFLVAYSYSQIYWAIIPIMLSTLLKNLWNLLCVAVARNEYARRYTKMRLTKRKALLTDIIGDQILHNHEMWLQMIGVFLQLKVINNPILKFHWTNSTTFSAMFYLVKWK